MLVSGELISKWGDGYATIELPEVDITKIKDGDKVWVELPISGDNPSWLAKYKTIAHFPPNKKTEEKIKVPDSQELSVTIERLTNLHTAFMLSDSTRSRLTEGKLKGYIVALEIAINYLAEQK